MPDGRRAFFCSRGEDHLQPPVVDVLLADDAGGGERLKVGKHLVLGPVIIVHHLVEEPGKAGLGVAHDPPGAGEGGQGRGTLVSVEVNYQIKFLAPHIADVFDKGWQPVVGSFFIDKEAFVQVGIAADQIGQLFIRQQGQPGLGIGVAQGAEHRGNDHQIPDVHQVYDQYIFECFP